MIKVLFIEARKKPERTRLKLNLPKQIHILYTVQYKEQAEKIKKQLEKKHKILGFTQVLGCSKLKPKDSPLLIGSGTFHAKQLALSTNKEIFVLEQGNLSKISKKEIFKLKQVEKGKISKFLASDNIGVLFSKKPGQKQAFNIVNKLKNRFREKNFYAFISDNISIEELENFPIDFWINTSCPGLELDSKQVINYYTVAAL